MKKKIAFFDFDGTITTKDTMLELIKYHHGKLKWFAGLIFLSPYLLGMKLNLISNQAAKEKMLAYFFGGMGVNEFQKLCDKFSKDRLPAILRPKAISMIRQLQNDMVEIVVVSASAENWVKGWCEENNIELVATCLETEKGRITGRLATKNCHGQEKLRRIKDKYDLSQYGLIYCYGDTKGDRPMLSIGTNTYYKPFR